MLSNATILTWMMLIPLLGGLALLALPPAHAKKARPLAMVFSLATLAVAILAAGRFDWGRGAYVGYQAGGGGAGAGGGGGEMGAQLAFRCDWIPSLGVHYFVGVDGLSMPLVLLAAAMAVMACWASYGIGKSPKGYFSLLLFLLSGLIGVFVSLDFLQFFVFFELILVPVYFLIGIWGGPRRDHAAIKFLAFGLIGSTAILVALVGIYERTRGMDLGTGGSGGGVLDLIALAADPAIKAALGTGGASGAGFGFGTVTFWLLFAGFAMRIPVAPVHTWLADALAEAPTPVSMIVAGSVLGTGAYGLMRVAYPIFPEQAAHGWFWAAVIGVVTIVHGAFGALAQKDFKRLAAYAAVSQMGYVVLGIAVMTPTAEAGALFAIVSEGITSAMLFFIVGVIFDRAHHREISRLGGLWTQMPMYTGWAAVGLLAAMGLPGLCGFIGELLVLLGTFSAGQQDGILMQHTSGAALRPLLWFGCIAAGAIILTGAYWFWTLQRVFMGAPRPEHHNFPGLTSSEKWILATLGIAAIVLGVWPMLILDPIRPAIEGVLRMMN